MKKGTKKVFHGEEPNLWEANIGRTSVERVGHVGRKIIEYQDNILTKLVGTTVSDHTAHDNYVHTMGAHLLQMQLRDGAGEDNNSKHGNNRKLSPKRIRVGEMEGTAGALMALDLEWDTRGWSDDMIEGGCDTLVYIFQEKDPNINQATKDKAVLMIGKMIGRHDVAFKYFKKTLDLTLNSSVSRLMRGGVSGSILDLLYVICGVKEKFHKDISQNGYCAKVFNMMILESKIAAILIQHTWRSSRERVKLRRLLTEALQQVKSATKRELPTVTSEWENVRDMQKTRTSMIIARNLELRQLWRLMHINNRRMNVGLRGPIHVGATHTTLALEIIRYLVAEQSSSSYSLLSANRLDVIQAHGCILFPVFISFTTGPFASCTAKILSECARSWESMFPMFQTGCTVACLKYMKHLRATRPLLLRNNVFPMKAGHGDESARSKDSGLTSRRSSSSRVRSRRRSSSVVTGDEGIDAGTMADRESYRACVDMVRHLAEHASGIYQAKQKVTSDGFEVIHPRKKKLAVSDPSRWPIDYLPVLEVLHDPRISGVEAGVTCPTSVVRYLGNKQLVADLVSAMTETLDAVIIKSLLRCLFTLSCCECISVVIEELVLFGGRPVVRLVELLEEENDEVSILSLCVLLQVCTVQAGRDALMVVNIQRHLAPLIVCSAANFTRTVYERAMLVTVALCRQSEWWAYDPLDLAQQLTDTRDTIRRSVWLDLLRTVKSPSNGVADSLTIADLAVLPTDHDAAKEMSVTAETVGAREISDFICHPTDETFFENLPWDEGVGSCVILEGLSIHPGTAQSMFNTGTVYFLGRCLYSSRLVFMDKPLSDRRMVLLVKGVTASAHALCNLCNVCYDIRDNAEAVIVGVRQSSVLEAACYYIGTLAVKHPALDEALFRLQQEMGTSVVAFFGAYASLLLFVRGADSSELGELSSAGCALCELLSKVCVVHGRTQIAWEMLDNLCHLLSRLTVSRSGSFAAVTEWKVIEALRVHLPAPLSGMVIQGIDDEMYSDGLGRLSAAYFHLCANLCQMDRGRSAALSEGFLRRGLEKLMIIKHHLETPKQMSTWRRLYEKKTPPTPSTTRKEVHACLHLISCAANFQVPMYGASNDLIFWKEYDVMGVCCDIISAEECPRCEETVVMAVKTLCELSKDTSRLADAFVEIDIIQLVKSQLDLIEDEFMPDSVIEDCIAIVENVAAGFWNEYLEEYIKEWRQPLGKITRVKPKFEVLVRDAQWAITKAFNSRAAHTVCKQITVDVLSRSASACSAPPPMEGEEEEEGTSSINELSHDGIYHYNGEMERKWPSEIDRAGGAGYAAGAAVAVTGGVNYYEGLSIEVDDSLYEYAQKDELNNHQGTLESNQSSATTIPRGAAAAQTPQPQQRVGYKKLTPVKSLPMMSPAVMKLATPQNDHHPYGAKNRMHTAPAAASVDTRYRSARSSAKKTMRRNGYQEDGNEVEEEGVLQSWNGDDSFLDGIIEENSSSLPPPATPGSYDYCGVSSCGSLRLSSAGHTHTHGEMSHIGDKEKTASLLKLPMVEVGGFTPAGKLSARDPEYLKRLEKRKIAHGFYDPNLPSSPRGTDTDIGTYTVTADNSTSALLAAADERYNSIADITKSGFQSEGTPLRTPSSSAKRFSTGSKFGVSTGAGFGGYNKPSSPNVDPSLLKDFEDFYVTPRKHSSAAAVPGVTSAAKGGHQLAQGVGATPKSAMHKRGSASKYSAHINHDYSIPPSPSPVSHKVAGGGGGGGGGGRGGGFWGQQDSKSYDDFEKTALYNAAAFGDYTTTAADFSAQGTSRLGTGSRPGTNSALRPLRLSSTGKRKPSARKAAPQMPQPLTVMDVDDLPELGITRPPLPSRNLTRAVVRTGKN